jgi:multidrug resistance efflux pump
LWTKPGLSSTPVIEIAEQESAHKSTETLKFGSVEPRETAPIWCEFFGKISEVYVADGQMVKTGQPMIKLDLYAVNNSSDDPAKGQKKGQGVPSPDSYESALKQYNLFQKLYEQGAISRKMLESSAARLQNAKDGPTNGVVSNFTPDANTPIQGTAVILASQDGIVTGMKATAGSVVQPGQQLLALGSGQEIEVIISLKQSDLQWVGLGSPVVIEVEDQRIAGQVASIVPDVQENKIAAFLAHITVVNPPAGLLQAGMLVKVQLDHG